MAMPTDARTHRRGTMRLPGALAVSLLVLGLADVGLVRAQIGERPEPSGPSALAPPRGVAATVPSQADPPLFPGLVDLVREDPWIEQTDPVAARADRLERRQHIDIRDPGPDLATFPNSAFTLPKGRFQVETTPFSLYGPSQVSSSQFNTEFLLRYGLTDHLELRLFSNGYTAQDNPRTTGFSPLTFDLKAHLWEENPRFFVPATALEVYLLTEFGSPAFNGGCQPSMSLNLDHTLPLDTTLETNFSVTGVQNRDGQVDYQFGFQWSLEHEVTQRLTLFQHGFYNAANLPRLPSSNGAPAGVADQTAVVVGAGAIWTLNRRCAFWASYNAGLTPDSPTTIALIGLAIGF